MPIKGDIQKLSPSSIIELFEIDATSIGGTIYRFHAGKNGLLADIVWNGLTYNAFPIEASGFEWNGKGQLPRPKVVVSNVLGTITALVLAYQDLIGCKFTRIRTLAKYLDAVNFPDRRNLLLNTEYNPTYWQSMFTGAVVATGIDDPFGGNSAIRWSATSGTTQLLRLAGQSVGITAGQTYTLSFYCRAKKAPSGVSTDLADGLLGGAYSSQLVLNEWRRVQFTATYGASSTAGFLDLYSDTSASNILDFYGPQVEVGSAPTDYQAIGSSWNRNPTADPAAEFARDVYYVDRKSNETKDYVEFELAAALDLAGVALPRRQIIQNYCPWQYRGAECGYTGTSYFNVNDTVVGSLAQDVCGKRLKSCRLRFGQTAELPYGGFPAAGLVRA